MEVLPSEVAMARSFSTEDVKSLILQYKQLQVDLHGILESTQRESKSAVEKAATKVIDSKVLSGSISDDLRRGQSKAPKTFDTQALMSALYRCIHSAPIVDLCLALSNEHGRQVQAALQALQQISSPFRRFFAGSKGKASAEAAYDYLSSLASGIWGNTIRQSVEAIRQINSVSPTSAFMDYENNPDTYYQALIECAPNTVRTDRPLSQMIPIISRHEALLGQYRDASSRLSQKLTDDQNAVRQSAEKSLAAGVIEQLRGFEVESLSQRRSAIRVKALRDAGYNTIEDVYCATVSNLASVYGISEDAAKVIKSEARKMAEEVQKTVRLKISSDQKTQEITALLTALYAYMRDKTAIDFFESIESSSKTVITGINAFRRLSNNLSWLFLSDSGRTEYCVIYQRLSSLIDSDYPKAIAAIQTRSNSQDRYNASEVWGHFSNHSIDYFNALERLVPGILGNGDTLYGLPEDLAREIQDQTFFPQGLKVTLRRYQEWGVKYILHQERVLLGDEMGLGKTVQALGTMVSLRNTGATHFLVVCPASVLPNWCKEIDRKSEFRSTKVHGPNRQNAIDEWIKTGGVAVTTYETTSLIDIPKNYRFDLLVVDEAHYIKNIDARRSKSVRELSEKAKRILFMTGTALENRVDEMISLIDVLRPNLANRIRSIAFMSSAPQFREQVAPVYYRRKRDDVLTELPDVINNEEMCELLPEEEALYENAVLSKHQTGIRRVSWMIEDLNKSSKARRMREILADAEDDGRKVLIFSFYRDTLKAISSFLGSRCTQIINGSVPVERRQQIIDEFEDMPAGSVLLAQIGAGGTGLNIQAASVVIICEPQLKPSTENQAIARAHRMGQSRTVLVYRLLAADTIDERIDDMLKEKQAIFDAFADKSAAADATNREESQIDDKTLGKLILEEINRINAKNGNTGPAQTLGVVIPTEEDVSDNTTVTVEVKPRLSESPRSEESLTAPDARAKSEPTHLGNREAVLTKTESAKEERVQSPKGADPPVVTFPSIELLVQYLSCNGIEYKDNRPKNGCLWIKAEAFPNARAVRVDGRRLMYSKASKALKGEAGWYIS